MTIDERGYGAPGEPATGAAETTAESPGQGTGMATHVKEQTRDLKNQVVDQARDTIQQVRDTAGSTVSGSKRQIAGQVGSIARALHATSDQLRNDDQPDLARLGDAAARGVERVSQYLEEREPGDLLDDLERLATRQPTLFVAGAFALGVLAGRFLKSSAPMPTVSYTPDAELEQPSPLPRGEPYGVDPTLEARNADVW